MPILMQCLSFRAILLIFTLLIFLINSCQSEGLGTNISNTSQEKYIQTSSRSSTICAIKENRTLACWGNPYNVKNVPIGGSYAQVAQSSGGICAITLTGELQCWGNRAGTPPEGLFSWASEGGAFHSCAVRRNGQLACWISEFDEGEISYVVTQTPAGKFRMVSAGHLHSCAIRVDGTIACWGNNDFGQTDTPDGQYKYITSGLSFNCAIKIDDSIKCWGINDAGQTKAPSGTYAELSSGYYHSCAITIRGKTICWGAHEYKQLIVPRRKFKYISAGSSYSCGVDTDGLMLCWGDEKVIKKLPTPELTQAKTKQANVDQGMRFPDKPSDRTVIADGAGLLTLHSIYQIDQVAARLWQNEHVSLYVVTIDKLSSYGAIEITDYAQSLMDQWGVGANGNQYDILFLISRDDRKFRIHLGRGWSHQYDPQVESIIQSTIIPAFKQGNFNKGIVGGVHRLNRLSRNRR